MSRFLFATMPSVGHVAPLKPIARALVAAGHTVDWYAGRRFRAGVEATGASYLPMSDALDQSGESMNDDHPERAALTGLAGIRWDLKHYFLDPVPQQVAELTARLDRQPADVLVADMGFLGAGPVHELTGVPWVSVGITPVPLPSRDTAPFGIALGPNSSPLGRMRNRLLNRVIGWMLRDVEKHHQEIRAQVGLPPTGRPAMATISPLLHVQNGVPEFEYPRSDLPAQVKFVGALVDPAAGGEPVLPDWWEDMLADPRPIVHVTQGTIANDNLDDLVLRTIRVLADEDVLVVATTGAADPAVLGPLPANARAAAFVPHRELLPHTAVMVTNGGYGGVQTALAHGVPLVVAGATEDKPEVAARVAWAGAGIDLRSAAPKDAALRDAIRTVRTDHRYRDGAQRLRDAYGRVDTAAEVTRLILGVTGRVPARG